MVYKYKSTTPTGINDIIPSKNEHPFEVMAYEIAEDYIKFKLSKYKIYNGSTYFTSTC